LRLNTDLKRRPKPNQCARKNSRISDCELRISNLEETIFRYSQSEIRNPKSEMKIAAHLVLLLLLFAAPISHANAARGAAQDGAPPPARIIRARSGDSLNKIAQRLNIPVADLVRLNGINENARLRKGMKINVPADAGNSETSGNEVGQVVGNRITLSDGYSFVADEVWKDADGIWYRKGNISQRLQGAVSSVKPIVKSPEPKPVAATEAPTPVKQPIAAATTGNVWIHLVGGARFRVDEVQETADGAWYSRGNLSIFMERERIARIEREMPGMIGAPRNTDWTSGNAWLDGLIRTNGEQHGLDPYLIFLVIEHESHFNHRAVSPKGARGLMQLMPATARRLGVRNSFDPVQNLNAGSRYLKELMTMFGGRVDLVLASYNAGEGAVMKYGRAVPPYRETRDYVKRITRRYGQPENPQLQTGKTSSAGRAQ
jgi:soluble lytic murein transglycosylase-like protein